MKLKKRAIFKTVWWVIVAMTVLSTIAFTASLGR